MVRVPSQLSELSATSSAGSLGTCPGASKEKGHSPVILRSFSFVQNMVLVASPCVDLVLVSCSSYVGVTNRSHYQIRDTGDWGVYGQQKEQKEE